MQFRFSRCICIPTPNDEQAIDFYHRILGMPIVEKKPEYTELDGNPYRLFVEKGEARGPILEFVVENLINARKLLEANGCTVVRWEGKNKCCYMRDPFGLLFNLWEESEPTA